VERDKPFIKNSAEFTRLLDKYAPFVAVYLYWKVKIMMCVFFTKICGIPEKEANDGDRKLSRTQATGGEE